MKLLSALILSSLLTNLYWSMNYDDITKLLKQHIQNKPTVETGFAEIKNLLEKENNEKLIAMVDKVRLQREFTEWLTKTLKENPLSGDIKAIHFGLFTSAVNNREITTIYLCGSKRSPSEDKEDWNVGPKYFPKYYFVPKDFETIDKLYPNLTGDEEVLIFNGILNLLVINSISKFQAQLLKHHPNIYVATGFDSGDTYVLGNLMASGLKSE